MIQCLLGVYMNDIELQLRGYGLTTAEIIYRMPDYQAILQSYLWQELDLAPNFPVLMKFLEFWAKNLDGRIHSVTVGSTKVIHRPNFCYFSNEFILQ